jgi:hypothetical protein
MGGGVANATVKIIVKWDKSSFWLEQCGTCCFTEGGIEFYVFSDGQFDFNARSSVRDKSLNQQEREWK